jgi:TetR/AcrR family transcriptional repressor of multidrug resistance operon
MRPKNLVKEEAIRTIALQIIVEQGIENLSMQKLASAAGISRRTIYIKYENKEDLLIKLFIEEVLEAYEKAVIQDFDPEMEFSTGVKKPWQNSSKYAN